MPLLCEGEWQLDLTLIRPRQTFTLPVLSVNWSSELKEKVHKKKIISFLSQSLLTLWRVTEILVLALCWWDITVLLRPVCDLDFIHCLCEFIYPGHYGWIFFLHKMAGSHHCVNYVRLASTLPCCVLQCYCPKSIRWSLSQAGKRVDKRILSVKITTVIWNNIGKGYHLLQGWTEHLGLVFQSFSSLHRLRLVLDSKRLSRSSCLRFARWDLE